jgi:hypothetical protein
MECKYHRILEKLNDVIWNRIDSHYDWQFFGYWLGDDSRLCLSYKTVIEEILEEPLTAEQNTIIEKCGNNLESVIGKCCRKWQDNHPELQNEKMPRFCLRIKIYQYIIYQLKKPYMISIIGNPC